MPPTVAGNEQPLKHLTIGLTSQRMGPEFHRAFVGG
jgi:hypothetical protein